MNSNALGINVDGDGGINFDAVVKFVGELQSAYTVVINAPKLATLLKPTGTQVIYRRKVDGNPVDDDDNVLLVDDLLAMQTSAKQFAQKRIAEAPSDAVIYGTNEPFQGRLDLLNLWTLYFLDTLKAANRVGCILNISEGNPHTQEIDGIDDWAVLEPCIRKNNEMGGVWGHHDYISLDLDESFKYHAGRWFTAWKRFGGQVVVTETGYAGGWNGQIEQGQYADVLDLTLQRYKPYGAGVCIFSWQLWS